VSTTNLAKKCKGKDPIQKGLYPRVAEEALDQSFLVPHM
jgi:hypothetical protein